jgi:hypothetical protein
LHLACFFLLLICCLSNIFLVLALPGGDTCPSWFLISLLVSSNDHGGCCILMGLCGGVLDLLLVFPVPVIRSWVKWMVVVSEVRLSMVAWWLCTLTDVLTAHNLLDMSELPVSMLLL